MVITAQQTPAGPYTAAQAATGRGIYQASCAGCHGADLGGVNNAAPLAGGLFIGSWGNRTTNDLVGFLQGAMPPGNPGSLGEEAYVNVVAFLLDYNGARPGNQALTAATKTEIRSVATGQVRAVGSGWRPRWRGRRGAGPAERRWAGERKPRFRQRLGGSRFIGEVKNLYAVTDAMMRNPDPSDWLMLRHDYHANELQPVEPDHRAEREGAATRMGVGHERGNQSAGSGGPQRHHVHQQSGQHGTGARRANRRAHLGKSHR